MNTDPNETRSEKETAHKPAFWQNMDSLNAQTKKGLVIALIVFLILVAFGFMAARSLPGESLYSVKTGFLEELDRAVQWNAQSKAQFYVRTLESRLDELKSLTQKEAFTTQAHNSFRRAVEENSAAFSTLIAQTETGLSLEDALLAAEDYTNVAAAMETISERDPKLQELGEFLEDVRRESANLYKDQVDRFVERETPERIYEFIKARLTEVSDALSGGGLHEDVIDDAEVYINRVGPSVAEGDYPRAIVAIAEAMRFIQVERYGANVTETPEETTEQESAPTSTSTATSTREESTPAVETPAPPAFTFPE